MSRVRPFPDAQNTVLMIRYAGNALNDFSELDARAKRTLFHRLVRLHRSGVQHNDLEPRNVVIAAKSSASSASGPVIIDFDRAELDHDCPGPSCEELLQVAKDLGLDIGVEMERQVQEEGKTSVYGVVVAFVSAVVFALFRLPHRPHND
ncbi:hypothetical protein B0H16DRAFT_440208 [Mycena metata]|uniref:Protein kinase domain-containing protein n=1 Tax=Mycena metata TaxID=1033252 RepID=A0AAD7HCU0_9AGAR|nr:hypothetical protein B0H16DRAFT_440208 [Mycena metata]